MTQTKSEVDALGFVHSKYQLYYQGVKVENATYSIHARQGAIESITGRLRHANKLAVAPTLTAPAALKRATDFVGATQYMWQAPQEEAALKQRAQKDETSYLPQGELVIVANSLSPDPAKQGKLTLAWKFDIFARQPLSRAYIYVDAQTGEIVAQEAIMKSAVGPFDTRYSGTRSLVTDNNPGGGFRLRDYTRASGVETYNSYKTNTIGGAVDFVDADNNWTAAEYNNANFDNAAGDAHFGAQFTFDYWKNVHGRNSYDNLGTKIRGYVHFNPTAQSGWDNARWDGSEMLYGDGYTNYKPLTSLDVCAHEIGHGVCASTANLAYQAEPGALNEGFSDIWGACVEQYTTANLGLVKSTWLIGEEIVNAGTALRSMSNPKALGQPGYYKGQYWVTDPGFYTDGNDYGGVHTNSGVLNHWFYILTQGESGTNEGGNAYAVNGIGINSAAKIAYRAESAYLQASGKFEDARRYTQLAAEDLFGVCSAEAIATANAWLAVGVGNGIYVGTPPTPSLYATKLSASNEPTRVRFSVTNAPLGAVGYNWYVNGSLYETTTFNEFDYYFPCRVTKTITCVLTSCTSSSATSNGVLVTGECSRTASQASYAYAPNPANDELIVTAADPAADGSTSTQQGFATTSSSPPPLFTVQLYNSFGQPVRTVSSENGKVRLKLSDLPSGLYTLRTGSGPDALNAHIQVTH